ncbi:MAG: TetR/AcrR family transcriptional regulator [Deltaproteobacteria bacterium]|nr:TetR/AcrR family transcriptional regulator [Deltaproteobacteria bacterium]
MTETQLPRRERERLIRRQEILDAGLALFSEKGFHNVSMHEIAKKSEFAIGTLYKFFKNKEDLYKALVLEQADRFHRALTAAIQGPGDEIEKIRNYIRAKGEVFTANASMIRLYFAETRGASFNVRAGLDSEIRERYGKFLEMLASVFEQGIKKNRFKHIFDPLYLAVALDSLTNAFLFLWLEDPEEHPYSLNVEKILQIFFGSLVVTEEMSPCAEGQ